MNFQKQMTVHHNETLHYGAIGTDRNVAYFSCNSFIYYEGGLMFITLQTQSPKLTTFSYSSSVFFTNAWFCNNTKQVSVI